MLVAVPRLVASVVKPGTFPIGEVWGDATLPAPGTWRNVFTGEDHEGDELPLRDLFATFPVAVLEKLTTERRGAATST